MLPILKMGVLLGMVFPCFLGCEVKDKNQKSVTVHEIAYDGHPSLQQVSTLLEENTPIQNLSELNWEAFPYQPKVRFRIAHYKNQIWLKFYVEENYVLAQRTTTNSATHKDSCVEFFVDPMQDGNYYNFEFNAIGVTHLAYGPSRKERVFVDPELIEKQVKIESSLGNKPFLEKSGPVSWEMTIVIPVETFAFTQNMSLKGLRSKANFYKCGDETSKPHYVTWNPVGTEKPDFHQPQFFGNLVFE